MEQTKIVGVQGVDETAADKDSDQPNFVAFRVAEQDYCVDILSVREISGWTHVTPLPRSAPYIRGVMNLRGAVVPVLDCPIRFGLEPNGDDSRQVIIVVRIADRTLGLLVDEVTEILNIPNSAVKPIPDANDTVSKPLVSGVIIQNERMIRLVDLSQIAPEMDPGRCSA